MERCNPGASECVPLFDIAENLFPVYGRLKKENHRNRLFLQI